VIELVPASITHVGPIASRMREWDVREAAAFGHSPKQALRLGLTASLWSLTAQVDGRPEAMLGLCPASLIEGRGTPWMLGTDEVYRHGRALAAGWQPLIARMLVDCPLLENWVAAGNRRAITFLRHVGFEVGEDVREIGGVGMVRFSLDAHGD
jgi:hypothetical protein